MTRDEFVVRLCSLASLAGEASGIAVGVAACQDRMTFDAVREETGLVGRDFQEGLAALAGALDPAGRDGGTWEADGKAGRAEATPAERILEWVYAFDESHPDFGPLVELAHELAGAEGRDAARGRRGERTEGC